MPTTNNSGGPTPMDEAAMVARANAEREKLFQRYERGREPGADIDPWEDPAYEVYHQTDRYGFIHDKRLPQRADPNEAKARSIEMERVKKWLKMTAKWDDRKTRDVLHKRVVKGIPDKMRSRVWTKLLNVEQTMAANRHVYADMLKLARAWSSEARQIDSDVNRQFREHWIYRERYSIKQRSLFNVLCAYSMYNSEVGYCQGMSGVAGVLLMYMDEEEAFWALSTILADKRFAMHGLYIEGFPKLTRFLAHHDVIVGKFMPKLKKHFDQYNLDSILYSLKWFFVIFIERIPFSLCLRVWDIYLLDGERVVTAMAYTILRLHKNKLLKLKDMDLIVQYIQTKLHKDFGYDDDYVIKMLEQTMEDLRKAKLDLPPPALPIEFAQKPFGVFVEPAFEAQVGIRKSIFSETEKEVTDTVILRRELTVQELQEEVAQQQQQQQQQQQSQSTSLTHTSNGQLNSSGIVPESEDGNSLLGSSRKSLADTSVTSTADLSVFSTGPRSQHAFDICVDDARSMRTEHDDDGDEERTGAGAAGGPDGDENGDLSPGSAFCSLSIVGRTPSAMMATPTPRAMSPLDIVRIYVPPAPPDETPSPPRTAATHGRRSLSASSQSLSRQQQPQQYAAALNGSRETLYSSTSNTATATGQHYRQRHGASATAAAKENGDRTPQPSRRPRSSAQQRASDEDLHAATLMHVYGGSQEPLYGPNTANTARSETSSSSRRGSLSRKSPSAQLLLQQPSEHNRLLLECAHIQAGSGGGGQRRASRSSVGAGGAGSVENVSLVHSQPADPAPSPAVQMTTFEQLAAQRQQMRASQESLQRPGQHQPQPPVASASRYVGESSNIAYQPLRRPSLTQNGGATGTVSDVVQSAYGRYYGAATAETAADDDDDDEDDDRRSSDESSTSPNSKSVLSTPVNEVVPLMPPPQQQQQQQHQQQQRRHDGDDSLDYSVLSTGSSSATSAAGGHYSRIPQLHAAVSPPVRKHSTHSHASSSSPPPTPTPSAAPIARPSRIPLMHKHSTTVSPDHSWSSSSVAGAADDGVLPPVEVAAPSSAHAKRQRQQIPLAVDERRRIPPPLAPVASVFAPVTEVRAAAAAVAQRPQQHHHHHHVHDLDSRIAAPLGGVYQFATPVQQQQQQQQQQQPHVSGIRKPTELNKIRIKINQSQRH